MGSTNWSTDYYQSRQKYKSSRGVDAFAYTQKLMSDPTLAKKTHDKLSPYGVVRESRDSDVHPESNSIIVFFDVTGSMGGIPRVLQKKLAKLMETFIKGNYIDHPQIMFGAVGDANTDRAPLQVGQFESGVEMDEDLERIYLEGCGGGQVHETYELAMYFAARKTSIDCWEKRCKKGYLFTMGDELFYPLVDKCHVSKLIGDNLEVSIPTEDIVKELQEKYEYYHIIVTSGTHGSNSGVINGWKRLLGERALKLDDPDAVCELIASTIGVSEGLEKDNVMRDLKDAGTDIATLGSVERAIKNINPGVMANVTGGSQTGTAGIRTL